MLKILQARLQQYMNHEFADVQAGFRKGRRTRDQIANICWITKKWGSSRKTSTSALLTLPKHLTVRITQETVENTQKMGIPNHLTCPWEMCMQVKKQLWELDMEEQTGSK